LNKGKILGIIGGIGLFLVILFIINYPNTDFDQKLVNEVEKGTSNTILIPQIEKQEELEKSKIKEHLESHIMDIKYWDESNIDPQNDLEYYIQIYEQELDIISECKQIRTQFVEKKIDKEQFLLKIENLKEKINI
jgi:hypothetical protein